MSGSNVGAKGLCAVIDATSMEVLPLIATDLGDGTAKLKIDASVTVDSIDIGDVDILEFPAGNLGQRAKAASLSIAPATDITDATYIGDIKFGESLPAGTSLLGKTSIDQTTDGSTNRVVAKISQIAGENHVEVFDSSGNGITSTVNALDINLKSGTLPDTAATDLAHIHANTDNLKTGDQVKSASLSVTPATDIADGRYIGDVKFGEELPAGTQLLGSIGIDQTTDGTTNAVHLTSGTNLVGKVGIDQVTANANEIVVKSITAGPLPDTNGSDLAGVHSGIDNIDGKIPVLSGGMVPVVMASEADIATMQDDIALIKASQSSIDGKLGALSRAPRSGQLTVISAGTELPLGATQVFREITVIAKVTNTSDIYVGNDGTDHVDSTTGAVVPPGGFVTFREVDIADIFIDAAVSGEGVSYAGGI